MRHGRSESDSIHYGHGGAKSLKAVVEASTRRARCAPYGKGRASINAVRACLRANHHMLLCHEAYATGVIITTAFFTRHGGNAGYPRIMKVFRVVVRQWVPVRL